MFAEEPSNADSWKERAPSGMSNVPTNEPSTNSRGISYLSNWPSSRELDVNLSPLVGVGRSTVVSSPQHSAVPVDNRAQVWFPPESMAVNRLPSGGDDWPKSSQPQQTGVPSDRKAHVCPPPLLIVVNRSPCGGDA